ncbi:ribonuclease HII [Vacuolonema iberomarrocanum]|uniref:ribonuclease HII n=1 Tax=Vacuolonema iberomarrocanum TaxID=3454632 RepID=UPI001A036C99|nr:ribonuclease HII [filamentous cyanobacterium LEGE 07170]
MGNIIAGVDEVGRGAIFGPVVAAAVILSEASAKHLAQLGVTDSKKLSPEKRDELFPQILAHAIDCKIGLASAREIERINILNASLLAMRRAIDRLNPAPTLCRIDGNRPIKDLPLSQETVIKGDLLHVEIAAASVIAKVWRDRLIIRLDKRFPGYDLASNKGYGTVKHRRAIATLGFSSQHRRTFNINTAIEQMDLFSQQELSSRKGASLQEER